MVYINGKPVTMAVATRDAGYDEGWAAGSAAGAGAADALLDGTAFADGTYTNNTVKSLRPYAFFYASIESASFGQLETIGNNSFENSSIKTINVPKLKRIGNSSFKSCANLTGDWSFLENIDTLGRQALRYCKLPESINFAELTSIDGYTGSPFGNVVTVKHLRFPKLTEYGTSAVVTSVANSIIETIECGSVGFGVTSISSGAFNDTAKTITSITIYCDDPNNPPAGSPWGAPNATVTFLKA